MNTEDLLRATRDVHLLVPKPGPAAADGPRYWSMQLAGLHESFFKASIDSLRRQLLTPNASASRRRSLKTTDLYRSIATTLGARSYEHWLEVEKQRILELLAEHGMTRPADLIRWSHRPGFADPLTAQRLADRFFNSGLPLPKRLFTGVGSPLFAPSGYGRLTVNALAGQHMNDEERLDFCETHANEVVLRAEYMKGPDCPKYLDMTGRMLLLNAVSEFVGGMYNLLGDNLVQPKGDGPVFTAYDMSAEDIAFDRRVFDMFRAEIERSDRGWVDVIPLPGNDNIVFLKGNDGAFDWVVRDQRDKPFTANPLYPMFTLDELPSAMRSPNLPALLYFRPGEWRERLEHDAEHRHYAGGGSVANWPGHDKLLLREMMAERGYVPPRPPCGRTSMHFVRHRLQDRCLMISRLITIDEFWRFYEHSPWSRARMERARRANHRMDEDLAAVNLADPAHLPASVTWFDAIAFCRHYEQETGLPVRLLDIDEWRQICPSPARDIAREGWGDLTWVITGGDGVTGTESAHRYEDGGVLHFGRELTWASNREGLQFLSVVDFGEWLADYRSGQAPVANAATGKALMTGPLERDLCPAGFTMRYKGLKVGFRLCYAAEPDA